MCIPTTPPAGSSRRIWRRGLPVLMLSTVRRRRWPGPHRSRRCRRSSRRPRTPSSTPVWIWRRCAISSRTGKHCARCTPRSNLASPPRPVGCTPTKSRAGSCRTCANRPSDWGWGTGSKTSKAPTPTPITCWARLIKVTPSSKVVGDLALTLVGRGISATEFAEDPDRYDIPDSVIGFLRGELGDPAGGWPEPLRTRALEGRAEPKPVVAALG